LIRDTSEDKGETYTALRQTAEILRGDQGGAGEDGECRLHLDLKNGWCVSRSVDVKLQRWLVFVFGVVGVGLMW
jgi:hypothetical protein